jgi:hypothetical protein
MCKFNTVSGTQKRLLATTQNKELKDADLLTIIPCFDELNYVETNRLSTTVGLKHGRPDDSNHPLLYHDSSCCHVR